MGDNTLRRLVLLFAALAILFQGSAWAQGDVRVLVGGEQVLFQDFNVQNGNFYVQAADPSLKQVAGFLGQELNYDPKLNQISISGNNHVAYLFPSGLSLDGKNIPLGAPSFLHDGKWYISLNTLAKAMGVRLTVDAGQTTWYLDPYITAVSLRATLKGVSFTVSTTGPVEPSVTTLTNPDRIVADFPYAVLAKNVEAPQVSNGITGGVHVAQLQVGPNVVRLVIDLSNPDVHWQSGFDPSGREFSMSLSPNIALKNWAALEAPPKKTDASPSETSFVPSGSATSLDGIEFQTVGQGDQKQFVVQLKISGATPYEWHQLKGPDNRLFVDLKNCVQRITHPPEYQSPLLNDIRVAQFQKTPYPVARAVFALRDSYIVDIKPDSGGLAIVVSTTVQNLASNLTGSGTTGGNGPAAVARDAIPPLAAHVHPNGITVVLDPGHGGGDTGAIGPGNVREKDLTLDIALRLQKLLEQDGFTVLMTRETDRECLGYEGSAPAELQCRADVANRSHASLFISLHINASDQSWPHGIATYWYKALDVSLANTLQKKLGDETGFDNRGIIRARFYVLRHTTVPSVLVEMGFITNPEDESRLEQDSVREKLAEALQEGITDYAGIKQSSRL